MNTRTARAAAVCCLLVAWSTALAHPGHSHEREASHTDTPAATVSIEERAGFRWITANGVPDHETGAFPNRNNPNAISAQRHAYRVSLHPVMANRVTQARGQPFGVALNGVPFDPGTAEAWRNDRRSGWNIEAIGPGMDLGLDASNAHVQPSGAYHYHGVPNGLVVALAGAETPAEMTLVGWAADGFPIYARVAHERAEDAASAVRTMTTSYRLRQGVRPAEPNGPGGAFDGTYVQDYEHVEGLGDLDECNGRFGVTPEFPGGTYYYVLTDEFPYIPRCWRGTPDASFERNGPPPSGRGRPPGRPR